MSEFQEVIWAIVETPISKGRLNCFGDVATYRSGGSDEPSQRVTINGVSYSLWFDLAIVDGTWQQANASYFHLSRADWSNKPVTDAARRKVREVVIPAAIAYLNEHPEFVREGRRRDLINNINEVKAKLAFLQKDYDEQVAKAEALHSELDKLERGG